MLLAFLSLSADQSAQAPHTDDKCVDEVVQALGLSPEMVELFGGGQARHTLSPPLRNATDFSKDTKSVYYRGRPIPVADPASLKPAQISNIPTTSS